MLTGSLRGRANRWLKVWVQAGATWLVLSATLQAQQQSQQPKLPPSTSRDEKLRLNTIDAWEAHRLAFELNSDEAMGVAQRVVATQREISGDLHEDVAQTLVWLAGIATRLVRFEDASAARREAVEIWTKTRGADYRQTTDARYALERSDRLIVLDAPRRAKYRAAQQVLARAEKFEKNYEFPRKVALEREALGLLKEALGETHPEYAYCLERFAKNSIQSFSRNEADPTRRRVESLHKQAQDIRRQALGERHPDYALSLENKANWAPTDKDGAGSANEPLLRRALRSARRHRGRGIPTTRERFRDWATSSGIRGMEI